MNLVGPARRAGDPVTVVEHGEDARVVPDAQLGEHVERPERLLRDREERGPVAGDLPAGEILERPDGAAHLLAKDIRRLGVDEGVGIAVGCYFMASAGNRPHEFRVPVGDRAEDEKRRLDAGLRQQREELSSER